jgi:cytochrome c oxidase subunit 2
MFNMFLEIARNFQISFQDPASPIMNGIIDLHHDIFFFLILILFPVLYVFFYIVADSNYNWFNPTKEHIQTHRKDALSLANMTHGTLLEVIWTITPAIILMFIAVPSFSLLYSLDEILDASYTYKAIASQWYWNYQTPDGKDFESYMIQDLNLGQLRLLEVDNPLLVPTNTHLRFIITATDVLHSFAVPSLGIKIDAVPGRLNAVSTYIQRPGMFTGQCSELCGVNHGFMPINIFAVTPNKYEIT